MSKGPVINGEQYDTVVFRVTEWDDKGRPSKALIGYDDTTFDLRDDAVSREFLVGFLKHDCVQPQTRN
jgi:hypothetical protein